MPERYFTIVSVKTVRGHTKGSENTGGRFRGSPMAVAKKAASRVCRRSKIHGRCTFFITIKEITRGSQEKTYIYKVKRIRLPQNVNHSGMEIVHKYRLEAKRVDKIPKPRAHKAAKAV